MHQTHTHIRLSAGCVYCLHTQAVYIRPDDVPSKPQKGGKRLDDMDLAKKVRKQVASMLRAHSLPVLAWIVLADGTSLPKHATLFPDVLAYVVRDKPKEGAPNV